MLKYKYIIIEVRILYIHDSHIHTKYSFDVAKDGTGEIDRIIETAIARGVNEISLCDHYDIDGILDGIYPPYLADDAKKEIIAAKEKYDGKIQINYGIELGQAHVRPIEARTFLEKYQFDFVIASLHNMRAYPDFFFLKYEMMTPEFLNYLVKRNIKELLETVELGMLSTLAHITYINRYMTLCGVKFDFKPYYDDLSVLFKKLISSGKSLEVNTSGLRRGDITMPGRDLLSLYRECGGEAVTLGSDAHTADDVGMGIVEVAEMLRELGFRSQTVIRNGMLAQIEL